MAFDSHHPLQHKLGVVRTLVHRAKTVVTHEDDITSEMDHLKKALGGCGYGEWTFHAAQRSTSTEQQDTRAKQRNNNHLTGRPHLTLPYVRGVSEVLRRLFTKRGYSVHFKPSNRLREMLVAPKDKLTTNSKCGVVYQIPCFACDASYIGETERSLGTRLSEHRRDSNRSRSEIEEKNISALAEHAIHQNHQIDWESVRVLDQEASWFERGVRESAHIRIHRSALNKDGGRYQLPAVYSNVLQSFSSPSVGKD